MSDPAWKSEVVEETLGVDMVFTSHLLWIMRTSQLSPHRHPALMDGVLNFGLKAGFKNRRIGIFSLSHCASNQKGQHSSAQLQIKVKISG
jgi:hypothetical protein